MTNTAPFLITKLGVTLLWQGKPVSVDRSEGKTYDRIVAILKAPDDFYEGALDVALGDRATALAAALKARQIEGVVVENGEVRFNDEPVHGVIAERMLDMMDEGYDLTAMKRFLEKLMQNPSYRSKTGLYEFLEQAKMPITADGDFLAYKAVRRNWRDIHSGTMDNSIGKVVEVPRNAVDEDPDQTCSHGLHVCSHSYLPSFAHADGHVVIVKINPKDVVAVPRDYNNAKMRVCRYEVIGELENWYTERRDVLTTRTVWEEDDDGDYDWDEDDDDNDSLEAWWQ